MVGGVVVLLLTGLGTHANTFRIWRGGPELSRITHPVLFWSCQIAFILIGLSCVVFGMCLFRSLARQDRERERNLEQESVDSFKREHQITSTGNADDKHPGN